MMKKKMVLIVTMLIVLSLALVGCGSKNDGKPSDTNATGGIGQVEVNVKEETEEVEETEIEAGITSQRTLEEAIAEIGERPPMSNAMDVMHWYYQRDYYMTGHMKPDSDGYYQYVVGGKVLPCKTNIWDFIDVKEGARGEYYTFRLKDLIRSVGLEAEEGDAQGMKEDEIHKLDQRFYFDYSFEGNIYGYKTFYYAGCITDTSVAEEGIYRFENDGEFSLHTTTLKLIIISTYQLEHYGAGETYDEVQSYFEDWHKDSMGKIPD